MKDLASFQTFAQVAKTGSFVAAAETLDMSSSAVSKSIARLEQELGTKLLHRTTRKLSLTVDGESLLERVTPLLELLSELRDEFSQRRGELVGRLRLSVPSALARRVLVGPLTRFLRSHPRIQAETRCDDRVIDLVEQGVDVAVRTGRLEDSSSVVATRFFSYQTVLCAAPGVSVADLRELAEVEKIRFQIRAAGRCRPWRLQSDGAPVEVAGGGLVFEDLGAVCRAAVAGAGVAMLPSWACLEELQSGALVELLPQHRPPVTPVWLVYHDRRHVSSRIRVFVDEMQAQGGVLTTLYALT